MVLPKPIVEWDSVFQQTNSVDANTAHGFTVFPDGHFVESTNRRVYESVPHAIKWTEMKILDALVDRINREPIPLEQTIFPPDHDRRDHLLVLDNDFDDFEPGYTLFSDNPTATSYAADDWLDYLEIAALNAYLGYLDHKYGQVPPPDTVPPDTVL